MARIRQSRPVSGLAFQVLKTRPVSGLAFQKSLNLLSSLQRPDSLLPAGATRIPGDESWRNGVVLFAAWPAGASVAREPLEAVLSRAAGAGREVRIRAGSGSA